MTEEWKVCIIKLEEAIKYLQECREQLEKALKNIRRIKGAE